MCLQQVLDGGVCDSDQALCTITATTSQLVTRPQGLALPDIKSYFINVCYLLIIYIKTTNQFIGKYFICFYVNIVIEAYSCLFSPWLDLPD